MKKAKCIQIKQRDLKDCGPACIASIAAYYKLSLPVARIRQIAGTDKKGTSAYGIVKALENLKMLAKGIKTDEQGLKEIPLPAIAHMIMKNNLHHYVVVYSISKKWIKVMDPSMGKLTRYSRKVFSEYWTGILIITSPGGDFQPEKIGASNKQRFIYLLKPHKSTLIQVFIGAILYTLLGFSTSIYIQKLTDYIIQFQLKHALHFAGILMILFIVFQLVLGVIKSMLIIRTGQLIDSRLILGYYKHLLQLPQKFFDSMRVGEIISRIGDAGKIRSFLSDTSINFFLNLMILTFSIGLMFLFHWKLALVVCCILPFYAGIYAITNHLNKNQERKLMEKGAELESQLVESIQGIRTVKQMNMEKTMGHEVEWRFTDMLNVIFKSGGNAVFSGSSSDFVSKIFIVVLLWFGALLVFRQEITLGQLLSFYAIMGYMSGPAKGLIGINREIQHANIAADRLFEIMDLEKERQNGSIELKDAGKKEIEFKDVTFSYGTRGDLFQGLNFTLHAGEICAIIGESGSGKSSIANLLTGLYNIQQGTISIGGFPIEQYTQESINRNIAIVPQHTDLFSGTLIQNIAPGESDIDAERVLQICYRLGMKTFLENLSQGFNTILGEHGLTLSGGERQRIAIARALYRNPSILIFDEASSALDYRSEQQVMDILREEKEAGKSIIIISHRLASVVYADKILVMEKGKIIEEGTHKSLSEKEGFYQRMVEQGTYVQ